MYETIFCFHRLHLTQFMLLLKYLTDLNQFFIMKNVNTSIEESITVFVNIKTFNLSRLSNVL